MRWNFLEIGRCGDVVTKINTISYPRQLFKNPRKVLAVHHRTRNRDMNYIRQLNNNDITEEHQVIF